MANRIIRDWTDSKTMNDLTWQEEVLFTRLIMKADDFGNFFADASMIKSLLFPRKDGIRANDIDGWLNRLEAARLILRYPAKGDTFLHIRNYGQRLDRAKRKFPNEPPEVDNEAREITNAPPPETNPEKNPNPESEVNPNAHARGENFKNSPESKNRNPPPFSAPPPSLNPSQAMCEMFFEKSGSTKEKGAKFFFHYQSTGWKDGSGNDIRDWAAKAQKWIINDKNFQNGNNQRDKRREPAKHNDDFGSL